MSDYRTDRKALDLVGFAKRASTSVTAGDGGTAVIEQRGFFVVAPGPCGREPAERYVVIERAKIPDVIRQLRALK